MASILLSFVGQQDPFSEHTNKEGSIVTLVRHLWEKQCEIKRVVLLHTQNTQQGAEDTKEWLESEAVKLANNCIELIPVSNALSRDPVNLLLAVNEARKGIERGLEYFSKGDKLEFNASSGTPVMKSAWTVLQAAGYAPHSSVWQVRNPQQVQSGQTRVFETNVDTFKREFDVKVIQRQIRDYNYSGALVTLSETGLDAPVMEGLLNYAQCRISFDFQRAHTFIQPLRDFVDDRWIKQIAALRQKDQRALVREIYFNALIKLNNQNYSEFLIFVSGFQERLLWILVSEGLGLKRIPQSPQSKSAEFWQKINHCDSGALLDYLENYRLDNGRVLRLEHDKAPSRLLLKALARYFLQENVSLVNLIARLDDIGGDRNTFVHQFEGVSEIANQAEIQATLRNILKQIHNYNPTNPFDTLNQNLCDLLDKFLRPLT
ncbi:hypothetical protein [Phormidium sp. CCY1219]|uniref:hypothetical protein n=1 Tax=Phormidium sp. CCY1219 TaxID=2886104 RepID=UPI002D1F16A9|nr:hypothetical protein [Phormidium sp. CCY1219]MEB3830332.1 hypothetical protein [Phormidium sp. CCY1219]